MSRPPGRRILGWLAPLGAVLTATGAVMYVLPGPGLPLLSAGVVMLLIAAVLRPLGRERR